MSVAQMIYEFLGGNQFAILSGASRFTGTDKGLTFHIGVGAKGGVNFVRVTKRKNEERPRLGTSICNYDMEFLKYRGPDTIRVVLFENVDPIKMQQVYTEVTGFEVKL